MGEATVRRLSRGSIVALAACLLLGAAAANASGKRLKQRSVTVTVPENEDAAATAKCKQKEKAISGGFESAGFDFDSSLVPYGSYKQGGRGWTAAAANWTSSPQSLTAFVYCRAGKKLSTEQTDAPIPSTGQQSATATAKCAKGEKVVSGGYEIPDYELVDGNFIAEGYGYSSLKTGRREWSASGTAYSSEPVTIRAYAYCKEKARIKTKSASATFSELETVTANCPKGHRVVSGGFDNPDFGRGPTDPQILPFASMRLGGRGWTGSAFEEGASVDGTHVVYAYCEKKKKKK